jgi:hypothetical protein
MRKIDNEIKNNSSITLNGLVMTKYQSDTCPVKQYEHVPRGLAIQ